MKKIVLSTVAGAALIVSTVSGAFAADHTMPGTPGTPNCHGQTIAYLAQAAKNGLIDDAFHGIGGLGRAADLSVKEIQAVVDTYCTTV